MPAERNSRVLHLIQGVLIGARRGMDAVADDAREVGMEGLWARLSSEADRLATIQQEVERYPGFAPRDAEEAPQ